MVAAVRDWICTSRFEIWTTLTPGRVRTRSPKLVAGEAAIYFDPYRPEDIVRVLEIAVTGCAKNEYISRGMRQVSKYSWDKCADQMYGVYGKALASWR